MASNLRPIFSTARQSLFRPPPTASFAPRYQVRTAVASANAAKYKRKDTAGAKKKKKGYTSFRQHDLKNADQFALCDAIRYIRAFEVGQSPTSIKYEVAVRLRTLKNGPVIRNQFRLPHPVDTSVKVCVICPPDSIHAAAAVSAGAVLVGEDTVFEEIRNGNVDFDRCICHSDSLAKLGKSGVGKILGPKGLMPSAKTNTVVQDVAKTLKDLSGGCQYRERQGVIRLAIGQLKFTPEEMQSNIKAFMEHLKRDCTVLSNKIQKEIHEVVLSSTNSPGFSLNGQFRSQESVPTAALST